MTSFYELMDMDDTDDDQSRSFKPIWKVNRNNEEELLKWLNSEFNYLMKLNRPRHEEMIENLLIYKGSQYSPEDSKTINDFLDISRDRRSRNKNRLIINHLLDTVETVVSKSTRVSPAPEVLPANSNEIGDRNAARTSQNVLNYLAYINRLSMKYVNIKRQSLIFGEAYMTNLWNPDIGDIHPLWAEAKLNNFINPDTDKPYEGINPKKPLMTGEVENKIKVPWRVLLQDKDDFDEVNHCFTMEVRDIDELKIDYPKLKDKIKPLDMDIFDSNTLKTRKLRNETIEITFYHKKTKYMKEGIEVKFLLNTILEKKDLPYDHKKLPISRLTDLDIEGCLHAESLFSQAKGIQWRHNQLTSDIITNQRMMSKPKWMVPKGRADIKALGDARTIVQFSGRVAPQLVSMNPTPQEIFVMRKDLEEDLGKTMTVTGVSRRDPPPGVTASVAMRFMSELEAERVNVASTKQNEFFREVYQQNLSIAGSFYDEEDGRTMRVLGKDQEFEIQGFETANLSKAYDVIIRNIGSLAESKAVKESRIFDALDRRPELLTDEQLIDVLEIGAIDKMTSLVTEALRAAESENEALLSGKDVPEPAPYEDLITHWRSHVQRLQSFNLKMAAAPEDLESTEEHLYLTEFLMVEKAKENATFQAELAQLKLFPIYYRDGQGFKPSSKAHQKALVQGQSNRGEPVTGQIPGEDIEKTRAFDKKEKEEKEEK